MLYQKNIRVNSTHCFIMKIQNKQDLQQVICDHSTDIVFRDFMNLYKKCTTKPYSFLAIDTTFASDRLLHFRNNLLE